MSRKYREYTENQAVLVTKGSYLYSCDQCKKEAPGQGETYGSIIPASWYRIEFRKELLDKKEWEFCSWKCMRAFISIR